MGVKIYRTPELDKPVLFVGWPGIGNIGMLAVNTLKNLLKAEEFAEIEGPEFFYPRQVSIREGLLENLEFPASKFYFRGSEGQNVLFFIGEEQPSEGGRLYASGEKAYRMANLVLDVALRFDCRRVYTSGACVSTVHHLMRPRVCAVASTEKLCREAAGYPNTILMSELGGGREGEGIITGLNGLLLGVAKKRGLEGICLMGEIPDWLAGASFPYPKATRSVLEIFAGILGAELDLRILDKLEAHIDGIIEGLYAKFPPEMKEEYDQRKVAAQEGTGPITIQAKIFIDEPHRKGGDGGGRSPS
jgi:proteasome assembly chaperone (PAC2) family protein